MSNHGLTVGDGMFETMKVVDGTAFAMRRHLARLHRTADGLGLVVPYDDEALRDAIDDDDRRQPAGRGLGARHGHRRPRLRSDRLAATRRPTVVVQCGPATRVVGRGRRGHRAVAAQRAGRARRPEDDVVRRERRRPRARARAADADEALFANTVGNLCEGTGSNVFVGVDGRLLTPPLSSGCLAGVTRELLLELDLPIVEEPTCR